MCLPFPMLIYIRLVSSLWCGVWDTFWIKHSWTKVRIKPLRTSCSTVHWITVCCHLSTAYYKVTLKIHKYKSSVIASINNFVWGCHDSCHPASQKSKVQVNIKEYQLIESQIKGIYKCHSTNTVQYVTQWHFLLWNTI